MRYECECIGTFLRATSMSTYRGFVVDVYIVSCQVMDFTMFTATVLTAVHDIHTLGQ